ncbi:MAG: T9SS type A sorting domain-containing protein, partial [Bacteroidaceae bacterium]|nr:T9SS type A sorting domain-containing protein [Bacteroidaceae bacterium]
YYAYPEDSRILKTDHYGLIAQELREIYPDLVCEGSDGYLSVNYIEIIPLLIKSIQELRLQVDELTYSPEKATMRNGGTTNTDDIINTAVLYQNNPNPFTENTSIKCVIPQEVTKADLYIYDMNGRQIESRNISQRGNVSILIEGNSLDAGMYLYSLITDGTVVDTKRMILTR